MLCVPASETSGRPSGAYVRRPTVFYCFSIVFTSMNGIVPPVT